MHDARRPESTLLRVVPAVLLVPALAVFAITVLTTTAAISPPEDVYLEEHESLKYIGLAVVHLAIVGYAIWGLTELVRARSTPLWSTAVAYVVGGVTAPFLYLLAIRWFSGG